MNSSLTTVNRSSRRNQLPAAFDAGAAHREQEAAGVVVMLGEILELHAKPATRHRMIWVTGHFDQLAVLDMVEERASIGTILRAGTLDHAGFADMNGHRRLPQK
jgi:hypothetical protein